MKHIIMFVIVVLATPQIAAARGGHGGGHGGHSGGRSHGHGRSHSGHAHACTEVSSVVGYRRCSRFGNWSQNTPALSFDVGLATHRFIGRPFVAAGTLKEDTGTFPFRLGTESGQSLVTDTLAVQFRAALFVAGPLYLAGDLDLGGVVRGPRVWSTIDGMNAGPISTTYVATHGAVGLRAKLEPLALSGEIAGGARVLEYKVNDESVTVYQTHPELQARARADVWVSPRLSIGAMVGAGLVDRTDTVVAVFVTGHLRAFGGLW